MYYTTTTGSLVKNQLPRIYKFDCVYGLARFFLQKVNINIYCYHQDIVCNDFNEKNPNSSQIFLSSLLSLKLKISFSNIIKGISNKNCLRLLNSIPRLPALAATYNEGLCQSREVSIQVFLA